MTALQQEKQRHLWQDQNTTQGERRWPWHVKGTELPFPWMNPLGRSQSRTCRCPRAGLPLLIPRLNSRHRTCVHRNACGDPPLSLPAPGPAVVPVPKWGPTVVPKTTGTHRWPCNDRDPGLTQKKRGPTVKGTQRYPSSPGDPGMTFHRECMIR